MPVQVCRLGLPVLASVRFRGNAGPRGRHQAPFTVDQGKALLATSAGPRRVVVTGIGAVTPLGKSADASWDALVSGCSGVTAVPADGGYDGIPAQIGENEPAGTACGNSFRIVQTAYHGDCPG